MKKVVFILFIFITLSIYSQQTAFDKTLGKENAETLNSLIENFETKTLKKEYPNLTTENSYKEFLKDNYSKDHSIDKRKTFVESKLKLNIYCVPDSIWIKKRTFFLRKEIDVIETRYKCLNPNNEVIYNKTQSGVISKTLTLSKQEKKRVKINLIGSYIKALEKISNKSNFINFYLEHIKMTATPMLPPIMSYYILKNNINTNDYFVKRIIYINQIYR
jgi:hypothetical protein|tara:strand:+ start:966 stop:1619 length:654 start_codon:yes stop_codon:yes gene_type:complete